MVNHIRSEKGKHMQSYSPEATRTVLVITIGFLVIYYFTGWQWTIITAMLVGAAGVFSNRLSQLIHRVWMKIALILGVIIPNILLTIIFYLVLLPVALLARVFRKEQPLILDNRPDSMFREMKRRFVKEDFNKPW